MASIKLSDHAINEINDTVGKSIQDEARAHRGAVPGIASLASWFSEYGGLLSQYLPSLIQLGRELAAKGGGVPTIGEFFAAGNAIFNPAPAPAPVKPA